MPRFSIDYTQDVDAVYRHLTDPDAIHKRSEHLGEKNIRVSVDDGGGTKTITITREVESDLPSFAKKLFNSTNTIVERQEWRDAGDTKTCKAHIDVQGTPGSIEANATISPKGSGSTYDVEIEATAKVPLIRKKLEEFMGKTSMDSIRDQHQFNQSQLNAAG